MTCDIPPVDHGVVPRPCTEDVKDRNWDEVIEALDKLKSRDEFLAACIGSGGGGGGQETFPFKLTATLALGGSAAAVKRSRSAGAWVDGVAIVVKDLWNCGGRFWGRINDIGIAWQDQGTGEYIVMSLQTNARWVRYTLDETLTTDHATATVNHYWDGCDPADGSGDIVVYDARGMFTKWHCKGCKGLAVYNERNARYEIVDAQLMSKFYTGTLTGDVCVIPPVEDPPTPASIPSEADVLITSNVSQGYYSATAYNAAETAITSVTAQNPFGHVAASSKSVLIMAYDSGDTDLAFMVVDIQKNIKYTLPTTDPFTWSDACSITANCQYSAIEACDDTVPENIPIPFASQDVIDSFEVIHGYSPETCSIVAHTRKYCMIDRAMDGDDVTVATMTKMEVLTDWYVDLNDPGAYQYYDIKVSVDNAWVVCTSEGSEVPVHRLRRQDIIDSFTHVDEDSPEECTLTANTKESWVFGVPDPAVDGDDIAVITFEKHEVLIDIDVNSSAMYQDTVYLWVPCSKLGNTVSVISTSECPAP